MKNIFGNNISVTLFGESHGKMIGATLDGIAAGIKIDEEYIKQKMAQRKAYGKISTPRKEDDEPIFVSGVMNGITTGTPITILIENKNTSSKDYSQFLDTPRPSHADYTAEMKYGGFQDYRGGGHFSGRITAPLVAVGAILASALEKKGIKIGTHIKNLHGISDRDFDVLEDDIDYLSKTVFPVLDAKASEDMTKEIENAAAASDSVGGVLESIVIGMPKGVGEPWFDTVEGMLAHALFSVPAVKGVEFGAGFAIADMYGSEANDPFCMNNGAVLTETNNNGGINGGITNGMPLIFRTAIKPTPSIFKEQRTVSLSKSENTTLKIEGRHDPAIIHRARAVVDAVSAITLADLLVTKYGTDWLR